MKQHLKERSIVDQKNKYSLLILVKFESTSMTKNKVYFEKVKEKICNIVSTSEIAKATPSQIQEAVALHQKGKCPHNIIRDEAGYIYDIRYCAICGKCLGLI